MLYYERRFSSRFSNTPVFHYFQQIPNYDPMRTMISRSTFPFWFILSFIHLLHILHASS